MKIALCLLLLSLPGCLCPEKTAVPALKNAFVLISGEYGVYVAKDPGLSVEAKAIKMKTVERALTLFANLEKAKNP